MEEAFLAEHLDQDISERECLTNSSHVNNCDTDSQTLLTQNVTSNVESENMLNEPSCSKSSLSDDYLEDSAAEVLKSQLKSNDEASSDSVEFSDVVQGKRKQAKAFLLSDDDDDEDIRNDSSPIKENRKIQSPDSSNWRSTLLNSELYSDGDENSDDDLSSIENIKAAAKKKLRLVDDNVESENKKSRKSKTAAQKNTSKDEIKKIHSETQRMMRDASVSLPYHKPKQRSLTEFLNRKRVTPKTEGHLIKPRPKDLHSVVQVLEDRVSEVENFFCEETSNVEQDDSTISTVDKSTLDLTVTLPESEPFPLPVKESVDNVNSSNISDSPDLPNEDLNKEPTQASLNSSETDKLGVIPVLNVDNIKDTFSEDELFVIPSESASSDTPNQSRFESIKRLSIASKASLKPTLSRGKPGDMLDLDDEEDASARKNSEHQKVQNLIERFVQQVNYTKQAPKERDIEINVVHKVVGADGQVELKNDVVKLKVGSDKEDLQGSAFDRRQLLKDSLRKSMSAKKIAERMKRTQENTDHENQEECEPEEEIWSDDENPETDSEMEQESEEEFGEEKDDRPSSNLFIDAEADDSENEKESDDETSIKIRLPKKSKTDKFEKESKINKTGSLNLDLKESDGLSSFEGLTPNLEGSESSQEDFIPKIPSTQTNHESNIDELIQLCSGKFTDVKTTGDGPSRNLFGDDDDLEEDVKAFSRIVPSMQRADDETDSENSNDAQSKWIATDDAEEGIDSAALLSDEEEGKSQATFKRGKPSRIVLSDDEDDDKEDARSSAADEEEMHEEEKEYRGLNDFFENEAELSGSEVGSDDEREDDEDHWEEEEGDKEDLDENEVREQVGRAHFKTLLDQDQREVRIFQELFLEDGDLHSEGGGRKRQFKWTNNDDEDGETDTAELKSQEEIDQVDDPEDDQTWRKLRNEREKWLLQQQQKTANEVADLSLNMNWKGKAIKVNNTKSCGIQPDRVNASTLNIAPNSTDQVSNVKTIKPHSLVKRGSFLRRSEKDLSAIATLTKSALPVQAQRSGTNFVFANLTPERPANNRKQKNDETKQAEVQTSKGEISNNPPPSKKAKISSAKSIFSYF